MKLGATITELSDMLKNKEVSSSELFIYFKKRIEKYFNKAAEGGGGFHIGGFALGFLLGLIGVLIAYLINDDKKKERVKWSWIGCLVLVVILLLASL